MLETVPPRVLQASPAIATKTSVTPLAGSGIVESVPPAGKLMLKLASLALWMIALRRKSIPTDGRGDLRPRLVPPTMLLQTVVRCDTGLAERNGPRLSIADRLRRWVGESYGHGSANVRSAPSLRAMCRKPLAPAVHSPICHWNSPPSRSSMGYAAADSISPRRQQA